ncbi:hypothetical protein ACIGHN_27065 [Acidovorax sp. NPDC077693]|uniref:hypothetical protein n=1 Tax=unclassified Acidovorax TaxID=2684926 RepID=UPI0037C7D5BE
MESDGKESLAVPFRALGLAPETIAHIKSALDQGDGRALLHELLLRGLWDNVVDENWPQPQWLEQWRTLGANGFPIINATALERLLQGGADPHDLTDLVRSAQVLAIYNLAQLLDYPTQALGCEIPESASVQLHCVVGQAGDGRLVPHHNLTPLHSELLARDPSGRQGEPRSLERRQFQALPAECQAQILTLVRARNMSKAAALWKKQVGGDLGHSLHTVQALAGQLGLADANDQAS